jgi:hypothetical protein
MKDHVTKFAFVHELTVFWALEEVFFFFGRQLFVFRRVSCSSFKLREASFVRVSLPLDAKPPICAAEHHARGAPQECT